MLSSFLPCADLPPALRQSVEHMTGVHLRRALSLAVATAPPRLPASYFFSATAISLAPLRSPFDECLLRFEISYVADRRPPHSPPTSFKSFAVEDRPGEQCVRLRAGSGAEAIKIDATLFDNVAEPPPYVSLFHRVEALERGPRLHLSLVVEVSRVDRVLGFICFAWPDHLTVRHVLTLRAAGAAATGDRGALDFRKLQAAERRAVKKFLEEREVDADLAEFLHEYVANKEKMELLR